MKNFIQKIITIAVLPCIASAVSLPLNSEASVLVTRLTRSYLQGKDIVLQKNIAIGEISNTTLRTKQHNLGEAFRALLVSKFSGAMAFQVVERRDLASVMREQALSQTGLTDTEKAAKAGQILNVDALVTGTVSEVGESLVFTVQIADVETGKILSETVNAPFAECIALRERQLDMAYVHEMGVGFTVNFLGQTMSGNKPTLSPVLAFQNTALARMFGFEVRYRFSDWLMMGIGYNKIWGQLYSVSSQAWAFDTSTRLITGSTSRGSGPFTIEGQGTGMPLMLYVNRSLSRRFNIFAGAGVEYVSMALRGGFKSDGQEPRGGGKGFGVNEFGPELRCETGIVLLRAGAEFFVTPRMALAVNTGYDFGSFELDLSNQWHLVNLGRNIGGSTIDLNGFFLSPSMSFYF